MCKCIRNILVLLDSCWSCGGQAESWLTSTCPIILKFTHNVSGHLSSHLTPSPSVSGTSMSSKTPAGVLEDRHSLDWLLHVQSSWNLYTIFLVIFQVIWHHLQCVRTIHVLQSSWNLCTIKTGFFQKFLHRTCSIYIWSILSFHGDGFKFFRRTHATSSTLWFASQTKPPKRIG